MNHEPHEKHERISSIIPQMQTVKDFKAAGADMELIIKATGLSAEESQKL